MRSSNNVVTIKDMADLGHRIQEARKAAGLTQLKLAKEVGVAQRSVSNWEQAKREPGVFGLRAIARRLGKSMDQLIGLDLTAQEG